VGDSPLFVCNKKVANERPSLEKEGWAFPDQKKAFHQGSSSLIFQEQGRGMSPNNMKIQPDPKL